MNIIITKAHTHTNILHHDTTSISLLHFSTSGENNMPLEKFVETEEREGERERDRSSNMLLSAPKKTKQNFPKDN